MNEHPRSLLAFSAENPLSGQPDPGARESVAWENAVLAAAVLAVSPVSVTGIRLRSPAGPVRDAWLTGFLHLLPPSMPVKRIPAQISDSRLLGGLDLAATLQSGYPVAEKGLLAQAHGGIVVVAMAERLDLSTAAKIAGVMDRGVVLTERDGMALVSPARFGVIALDEGLDDEPLPSALSERLGIILDIRSLSHRDIRNFNLTSQTIEMARESVRQTTVPDEVVAALCSASQSLGIASVRAPLLAVQAARALAALRGRSCVTDEDATNASMLVLAPRATQLPSAKESEQEQSQTEEAENAASPPPPSAKNEEDAEKPNPEHLKELPPLEDIILDAALASLPPDILAALRASGTKGLNRTAGKAGQVAKLARRGRVIGSRSGDIRNGSRLDVIATLRQAAPWQRIRRQSAPFTSHVLVRRDDFRIVHYRQRAQTVTIFVVDASGSSALQRLAEAKGALRLLLAECYVRRDEVALISFRGTKADLVLAPTRSLVRAQRCLAALPGGGGTPLAAGIEAAASLADAVQRSGRTPSIVVMTDGRANVCADGRGGREEAQHEARSAARRFKALSASSVLIDTSPRPQALAAELSVLMNARYVPLPHADARSVAAAVVSGTRGAT